MDLNKIRIIDQYVSGELSLEATVDFENQLKENPSLKEEVALHQELIEGVKRASQRSIVQKARKRYHLNQLLKWGTISMSVFLISAFTTYQFFGKYKAVDNNQSSIVLAVNDIPNDQSLLSLDANVLNGTHEKVSFPISFDSKNTIESAIPNGFIVKSKFYDINPNRDTLLKIGNEGTCLKIPKYSFEESNGQMVKSTVILEYQEYRNSADIAFSGIPMIYNSQGEDNMFNSSGMFSIFGTSKGVPVQVAKDKSMTMDYRLVRKNPETNFYVLEEDSSNWKFVSQIATIPAKNQLIEVGGGSSNQIEAQPLNHKQLIADTIEGKPVWGTANDASTNEIRKKHRKIFDNIDNIEPQVAIEEWGGNANWNNNQPVIREGKQGTLLGGGPGSDPGHSYPDIVRGLNIGRFGVYNCDQIYRLQNVISVSPIYIDEKGQAIKDGKILSMIDLNYTGAFSFDPRSFMCNAKSDNVLLLFTQTGKMYLLDKGEFAKQEVKKGVSKIVMKEVTNTIKSTEDLQSHLGIN